MSLGGGPPRSLSQDLDRPSHHTRKTSRELGKQAPPPAPPPPCFASAHYSGWGGHSRGLGF